MRRPFTSARLLNLSLAASLLVTDTFSGGGGGFCCLYVDITGSVVSNCDFDLLGEFTPSISLTVLDLGNKRLPIVRSPDDLDPKDVKLSTKPVPDSYFGEVLRWFSGRQDGASEHLVYDRDLGGDVSLSMVVTRDDTDGLVDGETSADLFLRQVDAKTPFELGLSATWDAANDGFVIRAHDDQGDLGTPTLLPGVERVRLDLSWTEEGRTLTAQEHGGGFEGLPTFSYADVVPRTDQQFNASFGVSALGQGGQLALSLLRLETTALNAGSNGELAAAYASHLALQSFLQATVWSDPSLGFADPATAAFHLDQGAAALAAANAALDEAAEAGGVDDIHPNTNEKLLRKATKRGLKRAEKGAKKGEKLAAKKSGKTQSVFKQANRASWEARLLQARLFGFEAKHIDEYFDTVIIEVH